MIEFKDGIESDYGENTCIGIHSSIDPFRKKYAFNNGFTGRIGNTGVAYTMMNMCDYDTQCYDETDDIIYKIAKRLVTEHRTFKVDFKYNVEKGIGFDLERLVYLDSELSKLANNDDKHKFELILWNLKNRTQRLYYDNRLRLFHTSFAYIANLVMGNMRLRFSSPFGDENKYTTMVRFIELLKLYKKEYNGLGYKASNAKFDKFIHRIAIENFCLDEEDGELMIIASDMNYKVYEEEELNEL